MEFRRQRPGTTDELVAAEVRTYLPLGIGAGDIVVDVGANIGAFSLLASREGAELVYAVEPEPENYALLCENVRALSVIPYQAALVGTDAEELELYVSSTKSKTTHAPHAVRGREAIRVKAHNFNRYLEDRSPTVVKVDIEGGEYGLGLEELPDSVRALAVELHLNRKEWREQQAPALLEAIARQGFLPAREAKVGPRNWHTTGVWRR